MCKIKIIKIYNKTYLLLIICILIFYEYYYFIIYKNKNLT